MGDSADGHEERLDRRARQNEAREAAARRWSRWLVGQMDRAKMRQKDLALGSSGQLTPGVISKWVIGETVAAPDSAIIAARVLGADPIEALREAGYHEIVAVVSQVGGDGDPTVLKVQDDPRLTASQKAHIVETFRRDVEAARARALDSATFMAEYATPPR